MASKSALFGSLPLALLACGAPGRAPDASFKDRPAPLQFKPLLVMPLPQLEPEQPRGTPLATLSGRETPVRDVLLALFKDSSINLFVDPDVAGNATFDIKATSPFAM